MIAEWAELLMVGLGDGRKTGRLNGLATALDLSVKRGIMLSE